MQEGALLRMDQPPKEASERRAPMGPWHTQAMGVRKCRSGELCNTQRLALSATLALFACALVARAAPGGQALSEVWSEADGLQMKYSTNHDDLLSTKGSELSLSSNQNKQEAARPEEQASAQEQAEGQEESVSGGGDSSLNSGQPEESSANLGADEGSNSERAPSGEDQQAAGQEQAADNEQGADSSRQTNKVPAYRQPAQADSFAARKRGQQQQQRFIDPPQRFKQSDDLEDNSQPVRGRQAKASAEPDLPSFNSAFEHAEGGNEVASIDHGDDLQPNFGQELPGSAKFRQPGRLFKEAVRMAKVEEPAQKTESENGDESGSGEDESSSSSLEAANEKRQLDSERDGASQPEEPSQMDGERAFAAAEKVAASLRGRQNMIDFDRIVDTRQTRNGVAGGKFQPAALQRPNEMSSFEPANARTGARRFTTRGPAVDVFGGADDEEPGGRPFGQSEQRALVAGSTSHKERSVALSRQPSGASQAANYKQLAYSRGLGQQVGPEQADRRAPVAPNRPNKLDSPDSVRDNFISPGHYPGSMPHLTQAASESQRKELAAQQPVPESSKVVADQVGSSAAAAASAVVAPADPAQASSQQQQMPSSPLETAQTQLVASDTSYLAQSAASNPDVSRVAALATESPAASPLSGPTNEQTALLGQVTPEPESQPESQQIMAPLLLSTTTMAPMPATSTSPAPTTTSQPPSLKRFKFRKYR